MADNSKGPKLWRSAKLTEVELAGQKATLVNGLYIRPGTSDERMQEWVKKDYSKLMPLVTGKSVADLGANIGAFSRLALKNGAARILAVEPDKFDYEVLLLNLENTDSITLNEAVADSTGKATLYCNHRYSQGLHSLVPTRGRVPIECNTVSFRHLLTHYRFSVLKVDIEGAEYKLDWNLPARITAVAVEFHKLRKVKQAAIDIEKLILKQGFVVVQSPKLERPFQFYEWALGIYSR